MTAEEALTREQRLLLASARLPGDPHAGAALAVDVDDTVDWSMLIRRTREEGTTALLHAHLAGQPDLADRVPAAGRAQLATAYERTWARNAVLTDRWAEAASALAPMPIITLKGMALVHSCYADPGLRPMADIDLLIRPDHVATAGRVLRALGYRTPPDAGGHRYAHFVRDGAVIDLHWDLADYPRVAGVLAVDHAALWERARPLAVDGVDGLALGPEDVLLHLALHLTLGSEFGRLVWFTDVAAVLRRFGEACNWPLLVAEAARWRIQGVLGYVLGVAHDAVGADVPAAVLADLRPRGRRGRLAVRLLGGALPPSLAGPVSAPRAYLAETLLLDSPADVARVVRTTLFPPRTWLQSHYGTAARWRIPAWRVGHPLRVCYLGVRHLARRSPARAPTLPSDA